MPRIFDNIDEKLLDFLKYFNLRGWKLIQDEIEQFSGGKHSCCRLLVGMQRLPKDELHQRLGLGNKKTRMGSAEVTRLRKQVAQEFRQQLLMGTPTNEDEKGLQTLKKQLQSQKLIVKLYGRHPLHAKLYLIPQNHANLAAIAFLGSSNLTFSGLSGQGELNVDILDHDATQKLQTWFNDRWDDNFCVDISEELAEIIDQSWATEELIPLNDELRILIATDVLSEGQNLQDCAIIVNYDLPWAIIRLIQRAGRVDRIGQTADTILCYSFFPADGVEKLINLQGRLINRLQENAEVVGTDEAFFEGNENQVIMDLYTEKSEVIDEEEEGEVDLISEALQIWKNATDANPTLAKKIESLANVVYSTRHHRPTPEEPEGVMVYLRTAEGTDALAWVDKEGNSVTQSQTSILRMARCSLDTPAKPHHPSHHELVEKASNVLIKQSKSSGGQLGSPRSARAKTYERLKHYLEDNKYYGL
ncbi:MAG: phospholipase D-like domain-containing protein [Crocosphaera sp.]|nr:phospholipase D-like domain-containing protein [Crocosphaera sp.]